jgi:hypothetical protein
MNLFENKGSGRCDYRADKMTEPTQEEIKELWEWCLGNDVFISKAIDGELAIYRKISDTTQPEGFRLEFIDYGNDSIDLNNLDKYALPKLIREVATELEIHFDYLPNYNAWNCTLGDGFYNMGENKYSLAIKSGKTLESSLFRAIQEVIHNGR